MQDRTINAALLLLRARIIRGDGGGREHVEALLELRGVSLPHVWPGKRPDAAANGTMKRLLLAALRDGPRPMCELVGLVVAQRPDLARAAAYRRTDKAVQRLRLAGLILNGKNKERVRACLVGRLPSCIVPPRGVTAGASLGDELWARFFTAAPARRRRSVERYSFVKRA